MNKQVYVKCFRSSARFRAVWSLSLHSSKYKGPATIRIENVQNIIPLSGLFPAWDAVVTRGFGAICWDA